ncbi:MAG: alpha-amylase family glycosyl hydrolase [Bacteroidales bacterium]|nr:alpha-amylase family glycosyl hydrolase [Bacteroidales bacterium]MDD4031343.1 alpha-amylase family glycosyl hydrolase [Bacteroidales bacterium]MDD5732837.1 alpha-amylase family glycosyl hydrolase [Bacteroidales bacterium]
MKKSAIILCALFLLFASCRKDPTPGTDPDNGGSFSRVTDTPRAWDGNKRADITYQLLVYSFADKDGDGWGDFQGLKDKLEYIDQLGATAIWLSPVHPAMSYHGYDVKDYSKLNPVYGTMDSFKDFVRAAHQKNIKVYLDYVINHTGREHWWFSQAIRSADNPYRDYYIFSDDPRSDISDGKIPMIKTEGTSGYDSGQWFTVSTTGDKTLVFRLDWSNPAQPRLTVSETEAEAEDPGNDAPAADNAKYLYFGDGILRQFNDKGGGQYELVTDYASAWGFLIRTSATQWNNKTKYGAQSKTAATITYGKPFVLYTNDNPDVVYDLQLPGSTMFHSHFWTNWFADLNYGAVETAEQSPAFKAIVEDARIWIDAGIDGFRLDAVKHIYHNEFSGENPEFLKKFYTAVNDYYRQSRDHDIYMVGEVFSGYEQVAPYYKGLPALFEFSFWHRLQWALEQNTGCYLVKDILTYQNLYKQYRTDYIRATKLSNHDENRARSDLGGSLAKTKQAGAILLTAPGSPYVYYGEEMGYIGTKTRGDLYVRSPMYWGDSYTTSYTSEIDPALSQTVGTVLTQQADTASVLNVYRKFSRARNTYPALASGTMTEHPLYNDKASATHPQLAAWYLTGGGERMIVLHNLGKEQITFSLNDPLDKAAVTLGNVYMQKEKEGYIMKMDAYSSVVFTLK